MNHCPILNPSPIRGLRFSAGSKADLASLLRHHYRRGLPATLCAVRVARAPGETAQKGRIVAAASLSWPVPMLRARNRYFGVIGYGNALRFANANVRTISRVIVHPQFRAAGLAQELARQLIRACPTRYVECSSTMAEFAGFLTRCGFRQIATEPGEPAYFLLDKFHRRAAKGQGSDRPLAAAAQQELRPPGEEPV